MRLLRIFIIALLLTSCNALKYVPEGKKLYTQGIVDVDSEGLTKDKGALQSNVNKVIGPKPNSRFLWMRVGLWSHYKLARGDSGFIPRFINDKFGEEPVYLSDVNTDDTKKLILNRAENSGFFYGTVKSEIKEHERTASVKYTLTVSDPYLLETYTFTRDSLPIDRLIRQFLEETTLEPGTRFDLGKFKAERQRIDEFLKNRGYYQFNPDFLIFTSDTNQYKDRRYDLYLTFKEGTPSSGQIPYRLNEIEAFPNYSIRTTSSKTVDTITIGTIDYIQDTIIFKPELLHMHITFKEGDIYNKEDNELTTRRLSSLPIYQFAGVRYRPLDSLQTDSVGYLNASIRLTPGQQHELRLKLQGITKSNSFAGPGLTGSYRNKNLFQGGEVLEISGNVSYEVQLSGGSTSGLSSFQFKLNNSITYPRLIAPFKINPKKRYTIPNTKFSFDYAFQDRAEFYRLNSFFFSYGYNWKSSRFVFQEFTPISLMYTTVPQKTAQFQEILDQNPFLARNFEDQYIPAVLYTFRYSELGEVDRPNLFYLEANVDVAGLITGSVQKVSGTDADLFGVPFAQYFKGDIDFRYYRKLGPDKVLANRFFAGVGYPYGNSQSLPYIKQYFSGGPNSIRAFRVRSLGPGSYNPNGNSTNKLSFFDQSGDIRLELNTEYRFPLSGLLKGAVFVDAGNIWLVNENPAIEGGTFSSDWAKQIAMGTGFGFRVDIEFLVIRLDLAFPLRYPYEQEDGGYWESEFALWKRDWLSDKLVFNFAIGYPF